MCMGTFGLDLLYASYVEEETRETKILEDKLCISIQVIVTLPHENK